MFIYLIYYDLVLVFSKNEYYRKNAEKIRRQRRECHLKNKEKENEYSREYHMKHKEEINERHRKNRENNKERDIEYYKNNREKILKKAIIRRANLKLEVLQHYSKSDVPKCECCKEDRIVFLSIDHINGGGNKHRMEVGRELYRWLKKNNFPEGYRVLCMNCNTSIGFFGFCPHKDKEKYKEYMNSIYG